MVGKQNKIKLFCSLLFYLWTVKQVDGPWNKCEIELVKNKDEWCCRVDVHLHRELSIMRVIIMELIIVKVEYVELEVYVGDGV